MGSVFLIFCIPRVYREFVLLICMMYNFIMHFALFFVLSESELDGM